MDRLPERRSARSTGRFFLMQVSGENVLTATALFDWFKRSVRLVFRFPRVAVTYKSASVAVIKIGQISPAHTIESYATESTTVKKEFSSYFSVGAGEQDKQQWYADNQTQLLAVEAQLDATHVIINSMKCTLKIENKHATKDWHVYARAFWPGEDLAGDFKNLGLPAANTAVADNIELWTLLEGYPGIKKVVVGSNTTNGLPNIAYMDFFVNMDKMANFYLKSNRSPVDVNNAIQEWMLPRAFPDATAMDYTSAEVNQAPMIVLWAIDQDYGLPTLSESPLLFIEGKMVKRATIWRDMQNRKAVQADTQWSLLA